MTRLNVRWALLMAVAAGGALAGCSALDLGPEPSNFVGAAAGGKILLTDPDVHAVTPPADEEASGTMPSATMRGAMHPSGTMPGAANPSASATNPATSQPALGKAEVPAGVTLQQAILLGLQNNTSLLVQKYSVPIQRTNEEIQRAAFDPTVSGQLAGGRSGVPSNGITSKGGTTYTDQINAEVAAQEYLPTGTTISGQVFADNNFYTDAISTSGANLTVTQSLLRGGSLDANLAGLRESEIDTKSSQYELRGFAESVVDQIEETYWDLSFAERQVVIVQNAVQVAQAQLDSTNAIIKVGRISPTERAAAEAEVALQKENLINAKSTLESTRLKFLQLITPAGVPFWHRTVALRTLPIAPQGTMDPVDKHVAVALEFRPEMNQAKLLIQRGDLQVVKTKNGMLPQLDFFVTLGQTGYARAFGKSVDAALDNSDYSAIVGVRGSYALENRAARGEYHAAVLTREQSEDALENLAQTVQMDVRTQYIEVERTREQIDATRATRVAEETALRVETGKFRAGNSTSLLVATAQQNLFAAQLNEVQAVTGHLKALTLLYRLEGTLLFRRGLAAPGATPVKELAWKR